MEKQIRKTIHRKHCILKEKGFTLIELLIVIAIIGILAGVVLVSSNGAIDKSKRASALSTAASTLPELVTCQDDNGHSKNATINATTDPICCTTQSCGTIMTGHSEYWPDVYSTTGWQYGSGSGTTPTGDSNTGDYTFTLVKAGQTNIVCDMSISSCT